MITIHKYGLRIVDTQTLPLPRDHRILSVQEQRGEVCVWALVDTDSPPVSVRFWIVGTGHPFPHELAYAKEDTYLGTVQAGPLVWHVFAAEVIAETRKDTPP